MPVRSRFHTPADALDRRAGADRLCGGTGGIPTTRFTTDGSRLLLGDTDGRAWFVDSVPFRERFAKREASAGN